MNLFALRERFDKVSAPFVKTLARIPLSANGWTFVALLGGIIAAGLFIAGYHAAGVLTFAFRGFLDHVDGYVARTRGECSVLGAVLDDLSDRYVIGIFAFFVCAHYATEYPYLPYLGAFAVTGTLINAFCKPTVYAETGDAVREKGKTTHPMDKVGMFGSAEFLIYFGIPILIASYTDADWLIVVAVALTALMSHVSLIQRLLYVKRHYSAPRESGW